MVHFMIENGLPSMSQTDVQKEARRKLDMTQSFAGQSPSKMKEIYDLVSITRCLLERLTHLFT